VVRSPPDRAAIWSAVTFSFGLNLATSLRSGESGSFGTRGKLMQTPGSCDTSAMKLRRTDSFFARRTSAGQIIVKGDWTATSLVAGVFDSTADGFGQNDAVIPDDHTTNIFARISSIVIKGTATGSAAPGDHYGITAQKVGKLSIGGEKIPLDKNASDTILLDTTNNDFTLVEI